MVTVVSSLAALVLGYLNGGEFALGLARDVGGLLEDEVRDEEV